MRRRMKEKNEWDMCWEEKEMKKNENLWLQANIFKCKMRGGQVLCQEASTILLEATTIRAYQHFDADEGQSTWEGTEVLSTSHEHC